MLIYEEDIVLLVKHKDSLQRHLDILNKFCDYFEMKSNTNKTKVMVIGIWDRDITITFNRVKLEIFSFLQVPRPWIWIETLVWRNL